MSTKVLMACGPPFSPSASSHRGAVRVVPNALWPSVQLCFDPIHHMVRSTMTGTPLVDSTFTDTGVSASARSSPATSIVRRLLAATVYVFTMGAPLGRM